MKNKVCQNPNCYTHKHNWTFTLSTAIDENSFCSLTCENEVNGVKTKKGKK